MNEYKVESQTDKTRDGQVGGQTERKENIEAIEISFHFA